MQKVSSCSVDDTGKTSRPFLSQKIADNSTKYTQKTTALFWQYIGTSICLNTAATIVIVTLLILVFVFFFFLSSFHFSLFFFLICCCWLVTKGKKKDNFFFIQYTLSSVYRYKEKILFMCVCACVFMSVSIQNLHYLVVIVICYRRLCFQMFAAIVYSLPRLLLPIATIVAQQKIDVVRASVLRN